MFDRLARIVRQTDTHTHRPTDRQSDNAKTITPSADMGCNKRDHLVSLLELEDISMYSISNARACVGTPETFLNMLSNK